MQIQQQFITAVRAKEQQWQVGPLLPPAGPEKFCAAVLQPL